MRILLLTPALPYPPHQGGALRNFGILRGLHDAGHAITLLSFHDGSGVEAILPQLCAKIETVPLPTRTQMHRLRDLALTPHSDLARRLESPEFRDRLRDLLTTTQYDLIQFEGLEMAIYLPFVRQMQPNAKLVYDAHNAEYALQRAIASVELGSGKRLPAAAYSRMQAQRITRFERWICTQSDAVIAVSPEDAAALRPFRADGQVYVLPNGIFSEEYAAESQAVELGGAGKEPVLVFTGKMDYRPNVDAMQWFTDSIFPKIRDEFPDARLYIVGQKPHASLQPLREDDHVEVTGWVAQVQPFLSAAQVYVAPLRMGSGTRLKILEAMAARCAVVATSAAVAGLDTETRTALVIADTESAFADGVIKLLADAGKRESLGERAQKVVREHYDWSALIPCLIDIYRKLGLG